MEQIDVNFAFTYSCELEKIALVAGLCRVLCREEPLLRREPGAEVGLLEELTPGVASDYALIWSHLPAAGEISLLFKLLELKKWIYLHSHFYCQVFIYCNVV